MKKWLNTLLINLAALLFGAALPLAFAPYEIFPLAILSPAGLLVLWLRTSLKRTFWLGYLYGLGWFSTGIYWVYHSIHVFGDVPSALAMIITGGFIAILALFPAFVGYFTQRYFPTASTQKIVFAFPAIWILSEWIRSWLFTGFPWLLLGYSQTNSPLKGFAPLLSVYGVSLAILLTSALLVNAVLKLNQKEYRAAYLNFFAIIAIWTAGGLLNLIPWTKPVGNPISVSLVQGNIPQSLKWSPEHIQLSFDRYEQLTLPLWEKDRIIIWPEAAIPLSLPYAADFINRMDIKARANDSHLILGIPIPTDKNDGFYNAIVTVGQERQVYLKRRLVPFGEYTPSLPIFLRALNFMNIPMPNTMPGRPVQDPFMINNVKILASICYEIAFPELINTNDKNIGLLLTITNDAWFGESSAQAQHLQMAEMRAIELRRPVLFVSNDGITAIIGSDGRIETSAPPRQPFVLNGSVQPVYGLTPWMRNGIDPLLFIVIGLIIAAVRLNKKVAAQPAIHHVADSKTINIFINEAKK